MEYIGKLYGKLSGKYFDTGKTSEDWDELENNQPEWISVEDRLPEFGKIVLVYYPSYGPEAYQCDKVIMATYKKGFYNSHFRNPDEITHWMPLPSTEQLNK